MMMMLWMYGGDSDAARAPILALKTREGVYRYTRRARLTIYTHTLTEGSVVSWDPTTLPKW